MDIIDNKKKCIIIGCNNVGEWDKIRNLRVYRRRLCGNHRNNLKKNNTGRHSYVRENFKDIKCGECEYCGWKGPCDCHRPNEGRYTLDNMRAACPNCHRLISMKLMFDKFKK